jgi:uncharacterized protein (DUF1778 family)
MMLNRFAAVGLPFGPNILCNGTSRLYPAICRTIENAQRRVTAMPQTQTARAARLEARISPDLKRRLEYAASLRGATLTEFVVQSAQEAATRTIRENEVLTLSERARVAFAELLLNPPRPNRKAMAAARRYKADFAKG